MRVLVAGSRAWPDPSVVHWQLDHARTQLGEFTLVHGAAARGVDRFADDWARARGVAVERHAADWEHHDDRCPQWHLSQRSCKRAGMRRNTEMVTAGADLALVFVADGSSGSMHTLRTAAAAGIPTWLFVPGKAAKRMGR